MNDDMQSPLPTPSQEARQWAMFCHFAAFLGLVFPFGNLLGPLIVWQIKKDLDPFVDDRLPVLGADKYSPRSLFGLGRLICPTTQELESIARPRRRWLQGLPCGALRHLPSPSPPC